MFSCGLFRAQPRQPLDAAACAGDTRVDWIGSVDLALWLMYSILDFAFLACVGHFQPTSDKRQGPFPKASSLYPAISSTSLSRQVYLVLTCFRSF